MQYPQNERFYRLSIFKAGCFGIFISLFLFFCLKKERLVRLLICFDPTMQAGFFTEYPKGCGERSLSLIKQSFQPIEEKRTVHRLKRLLSDAVVEKSRYGCENDQERWKETGQRKVAYAGRASPPW